MSSPVTWCSLCTEIPYSSSQIEISAGAFSTPIALIDSQNIPSAQLALPIVPKAISLPWFENSVNCWSSCSSRYSREA